VTLTHLTDCALHHARDVAYYGWRYPDVSMSVVVGCGSAWRWRCRREPRL